MTVYHCTQNNQKIMKIEKWVRLCPRLKMIERDRINIGAAAPLASAHINQIVENLLCGQNGLDQKNESFIRSKLHLKLYSSSITLL